jgi:hypothetical protein
MKATVPAAHQARVVDRLTPTMGGFHSKAAIIATMIRSAPTGTEAAARYRRHDAGVQ